MNSAVLISKSSQKQQHKNNSISLNQSSHGLSFGSTDGYSSIMKGLNEIDNINYNGYETFATWENQNPNDPFLENFENQKGIVKKVFRDERYFWESWDVKLTFYDGFYIDKPSAQIHIQIESIEQDLELDRSNGKLKTESNYTISIMYLGFDDKVINYQTISGQISFYFVDKYTNQPQSSFPDYDISSNSVQISFVKNNSSSSVVTSLFSHYNDASTPDCVIHYSLAAASITVSLFSCYSQALAQKVSLWTVYAA